MLLFFSPHPGCFEAHLRRRYRNPLFAEVLRHPTQDEVNEARKRDEQEVRDFDSEFRQMLEQVGTLSPHVDSDVILKYKEQVEQFYERAAGLTGDRSRTRQGLERLHKLILSKMVEGVDNDPYAALQLEQGEEARAMHWKLLEYPLVAQLLRPDSPIGADELVPTLLSEQEDAIEAAMAMFDPAQRDQLVTQAEALVKGLSNEFLNLPSLRLRIKAMGRAMEL